MGLGSKTPHIVNPSQKDTENKIGNDDNNIEWSAKKITT
jgi:hypothetical protein